MDKIGNMNKKEFAKLINKSLSDTYVTKNDIKDFLTRLDIVDFVTRYELKQIVDKATDHSTNMIRLAVRESVAEANKDYRIKCREDTKNDLMRLGIDLEKPQEMQELIINLKKIVKNSQYAKKMFTGSLIKMLVAGGIAIILAGIAAYSSGYLNFIKIK